MKPAGINTCYLCGFIYEKTGDIVKKGGWKSSSSFRWFYNLPVVTVLSWDIWDNIFSDTLMTEMTPE